MKNLLAILGVLFVIAVIVIAGSAFWAYKKGPAKMAEMTQESIDGFIKTKNPPEAVANSLRRITNAAKMQKPMTAMVLLGVAMGTIDDGIVNYEEATILEEGAQLGEQGEIPQDKMTEFMKKAEKFMPQKYRKP